MDNQVHNSIVSFIWGLRMIAFVTFMSVVNIVMLFSL